MRILLGTLFARIISDFETLFHIEPAFSLSILVFLTVSVLLAGAQDIWEFRDYKGERY